MPANDVPAPALRLLGPAAVNPGGLSWVRLAPKDAALLARLALDGEQSRAAMAAWLWPGAPATRASANLRQRLFRLRQASGSRGAGIVADDGERLRLADGVALDLASDSAAFEQPLLADAELAEDGIGDWLDEARRRWQALRPDRMSGAAARLEAQGRMAEALALTDRLLVLEPLLEHAWRRLIRLHHRRGDRAAAVAAFERCERALRDELGLKPAPETQALLAQVEQLRAEPSAVAAPPPAHLHAALLRPPRRCGHEDAWAAMAGAWAAGAGFCLEAPAGMGKSRLLADFAAGHAGALLIAAQPGDDGVAYATLLRLLRVLAAQPDAGELWPADAAERRELARLLPELPALGPAPAAPGLEALLLQALDSLFAAMARRRLGLLIDDVHLADEASRVALHRLVVANADLRWGLAARPGAFDIPAPLARLALQPLQPAAAADLLQSLGPDAAALARAVGPQRLAAHCAGNPGFLLETLRHLLRHPPADPGAAALPLPPGMEAAIEQQIRGLSAPALALLRVVAVANGDSHAALAARVLDLPLLDLAEPWREAEAAQLIRADAAMPQALRQVLLARLPEPLRRALHERVAHALQAGGAPARAVARHFQAAGLVLPAARATRQAADDALRLGRFGERLALLEQAAAGFDAAAALAEAFDARLAAVPAINASAGPDAALVALDRLEQAIQPGSVSANPDDQPAAQASSTAAPVPGPAAGSAAQRTDLQLARAEVAIGAYRAGPALQAAALALADAEPGSAEALRAELLRHAAAGMAGQPLPPAEVARQLQERIAAVEDPLRACTLWSHAALIEHNAGRLLNCVALLHRQAQAARAAGHVAYEANAEASLGGLQLQLGEPDAAIVSARRAAALLRRMGDEQSGRQARLNEALALIGCDRLAPALALLEELAVGAETAIGAEVARIGRDLRAEAWWRCGEFERAAEALGPAPGPEFALARRLNHAMVAMLIAQARTARPGADQAEHDVGAGWAELRAMVGERQSIGIVLRARALSGVTLPPAPARAELDRLVRDAEDAASLPAAGLARLRRAAHAWRAGDLDAALDDALWLKAHAPQVRHLYVPGGEWRALVHDLLQAAGQDAEAQAFRVQAHAWFEREVRPALPPGSAGRWCAHPAYRGLFAGCAD